VIQGQPALVVEGHFGKQVFEFGFVALGFVQFEEFLVAFAFQVRVEFLIHRFFFLQQAGEVHFGVVLQVAQHAAAFGFAQIGFLQKVVK
jgi:hypothetical protein